MSTPTTNTTEAPSPSRATRLTRAIPLVASDLACGVVAAAMLGAYVVAFCAMAGVVGGTQRILTAWSGDAR